MSADPPRRAALLAAKLTVLARSAGAGALAPLGFPGGAAASGDGTLWVLGDGLGPRLLGPALAVAARAEDVVRLCVIADAPDDAAVLARRAALFGPGVASIDVFRVENTSLVPVTAPDTAPVAAGWADFSPLYGRKSAQLSAIEDEIAAAGATPVWEHGVLTAEVRGLEVGRVVDGQLQVGVGRHDRDAHLMANPDAASAAALRGLVGRVNAERRADGASGAMIAVARERWLRWVLCCHPHLVGATDLAPAPPAVIRTDLRSTAVAPAVGHLVDGGDVVVVCSVGVDPDLVPSAADARCLLDPDATLVMAMPEGDDVTSTHRLAAALRSPGLIRTVPPGWPALGDSPGA